MSSGIIVHFFPDITRFLQQNVPHVWQLVFPTKTQAQCPEHELAWGSSRLRNGTLIPIMGLAVVVGLLGFVRLRRRRTAAPTSAAYAHLFFSLMNLSAIVCHSLTEPRSKLWEVAAALDACCTASAALLACAAFCLERQLLARLAVHVTVPAAVFSGCFAGLALELPFVREFVYLLLTISAAMAMGCATCSSFAAGTGSRGLAVACVGVAMALSGLALDRHLCGWFGSLVNHMHPLFLGCTLIFAGLEAHYLAQAEADKEA